MTDTALLSAFAAGVRGGALRVVDLTHTLDEEFPTIQLPPQFGPSAPFRRDVISRYDEKGPAWYWSNISMGEHTGTHFDAPAHWISGRDLPNNTVDTIEPKNFIGPAVVIDCSAACAANPDFLLEPEHITAFEAKHGRIAPGSWLLMRTDWSKRKGAEYANMQADGAHTPGPSTAAVKFMIEERDVVGFGVEPIGTDAGQAHGFTPMYPAHTLLHGAGRYGLQCLRNLDLLPPTGAIVIAAPLKIDGGSGSPLRVLAVCAA
jgi:kynurenine formamidase